MLSRLLLRGCPVLHTKPSLMCMGAGGARVAQWGNGVFAKQCVDSLSLSRALSLCRCCSPFPCLSHRGFVVAWAGTAPSLR